MRLVLLLLVLSFPSFAQSFDCYPVFTLNGTAGAVILALLIMVVTLAQGRILGFGKAE